MTMTRAHQELTEVMQILAEAHRTGRTDRLIDAVTKIQFVQYDMCYAGLVAGARPMPDGRGGVLFDRTVYNAALERTP